MKVKHKKSGVSLNLQSISYVRFLQILADKFSPRLHEVMGDILGEWLNSTILREISDGLQWLESGSIDSANKKRHFEDDGNTLKAKISKPGNVQVTKV